ncbi:MAG: peptidylprolyl isomerase [Planctomycetota bacterium]|nr:peptidylprolyl isomerase [Planctomycetota bacterium]
MRHLLRLAPVLLLLVCATVSLAEEGPTTPSSNPVLIMKVKDVGTIEIELYPRVAPKTVKNFIDLAEGTREWKDPVSEKMVKKPFFDGLTFHRVIKNFMLQGGDPLGTGMGGPGYFFEDEINADALGLDKEKLFPDPKTGQPHPYILGLLPRDQQRGRFVFQQMVTEPLLKKLGIPLPEANKRIKEWQPKLIALTLKEVYENQGYKFSTTLPSIPMKKGYLAMANSGPNTNGSQFFLNLKDNLYLNGKHTVFGKVVKGMDVVERIGEMKTDGQTAKPIKPVVIDFVRLKK